MVTESRSRRGRQNGFDRATALDDTCRHPVLS
jgi:hypothetical protein